MELTDLIATRLEKVKRIIEEACAKANRDPSEVTIIAVTKNFGPEVVRAAVQCGITNIGESRIQEMLSKKEESPANVCWHMIGHLQTNKVIKCVENFEYLHSVDSVRLADELDKYAARLGKKMKILMQVNVGNDPAKYGVSVNSAEELADYILKKQNLEFLGLMTVLPFRPDPEDTRPMFRMLRFLRDRLQNRFDISLPVLSMGMSSDFRIAIEEGSTWIRLGTALFGERMS